MSNDLPSYAPELIEINGNVIMQVPEWVTTTLGSVGDIVVANSLSVDSERQAKLIRVLLAGADDQLEESTSEIDRHLGNTSAFYEQKVVSWSNVPPNADIETIDGYFREDLVVFSSLLPIWGAVQDKGGVNVDEQAFIDKYSFLFERMRAVHEQRMSFHISVSNLRGPVALKRFIGTPSDQSKAYAAMDEQLDEEALQERIEEYEVLHGVTKPSRTASIVKGAAGVEGGDVTGSAPASTGEYLEPSAQEQALELIGTHSLIVSRILSDKIQISDTDQATAVIVQDLHNYRDYGALTDVPDYVWDRVLRQSRVALGSSNAISRSASSMRPVGRPPTLETGAGGDSPRYYSGSRPAPEHQVDEHGVGESKENTSRYSRLLRRLLRRK